jgi:hypothetical protein
MGERIELKQAGAATGWELETTRYPDRTFYTLLHEGWVIAEFYCGPYGWRWSRLPSQALPGFVEWPQFSVVPSEF